MDTSQGLHDSAEEAFADPSARVSRACAVAQALEDAGSYEEARAALSAFWRGAGHPPRTEGLGPRAAAELLLRAGALTGWLGSARQLNGSQESAKDLIGRAARLFNESGETAREAEAMLELALCYLREGAFDEGRVLVRQALEMCGDDDRLKALATLRLGILETRAKRLHQALRIFTEAEALFRSLGDDSLCGRLHNHLATVYKNLGALEGNAGYLDQALIQFAAAAYYFEGAGHARYRARVENNLGFLHVMRGAPREAHPHLNTARYIFSGLKDKGSVAQVDETRARAYIAEERYEEALRAASDSVRALEGGDERSHLAESLTTRGLALARLGETDESLRTLKRAGAVAELAGDLEGAAAAALTVCEELHGRIPRREFVEAYTEADRRAGDSPQPQTLARLRACSRILFGLGGGSRRLTTQTILYASPKIVELLSVSRLVAPTASPVLILGEAGTGRRALAELIHEWSFRAGALSTFDCAGLPAGWDEAREATSGTLLLEGLERLGPEDQKRLLALVDHAAERESGLRVVVTADKDLALSVSNGDLSAALYHRLNAVVLEVPPLRERPEDVAALVPLFADEAAREFGTKAVFTPDAVEVIQRMPLLGNVPELCAFVTRLVVEKRGGVVRATDVDALARTWAQPAAGSAWRPCDLQQEVLRLEHYHIEQALRAAGGMVSKAAPLLGLKNVETLAAKIRQRHPDLLRARLPVRPRRRGLGGRGLKVITGNKKK